MKLFKDNQNSTDQDHEGVNAVLGIQFPKSSTAMPAIENKSVVSKTAKTATSQTKQSGKNELVTKILAPVIAPIDPTDVDEVLNALIPTIAEESINGERRKSWRELAEVDIAAAVNKCVEINLATERVTYSKDITLHRSITGLKDEEIARAWLVSRLANQLGYDPKAIQLESEYAAGRPKKGISQGTARIDVIVELEKDLPFYFIEAKAPNKFESDWGLIDDQLFAVAALHEGKTGKKPKFLVYYTVEDVAGQLRDKAIVIDYAKFSTYKDWSEAGFPSVSDTLSEKYNRPKKIPYVRKGPRDLNSKFFPSEVKDLATSLHNVLWGGGSTGDTEVFTSLVNIILAKIQDEYDTPEGEEYKFQVFQHGDVVEDAQSLYVRLNDLYRVALTKQLGKDGDLHDQHIVNKQKLPLSKLVFAVGQIEKYSFVDGKNSLNGKDLLGDFFEQIQRDGFKQSKGQFFTPVNVVKFMLYALELDKLAIDMINNEQKLPLIIDPSCGSATFLIETMKMITAEVKHRQHSRLKSTRQVQDTFETMFTPDHKEHKWAREYLYGIEHNFDLATAAKVNMILHGDGSTNIFHKDGLKPFSAYETPAAAGSPNVLKVRTQSDAYAKKDVNAQFHVIVSNPPFSVDLDDTTKKTLGNSFLFGGKKNSENLFIERYWQLLRDGGRMAIVLPESIFDTTENKYIRLFLFKYFHVRAVVSLPQLAFVPYTQTKTSILFAQKKSAREVAGWKALWDSQSSKYGKLCTRVQNFYKVYLDGDAQSGFSTIADKTDADARQFVSELLFEKLTPEEKAMPIVEFFRKKKYFVDLWLEVDIDAVDVFGRVNCGWVLRKVLEESEAAAAKKGDATLNQNIEMFMAEATSIGYKRSKRGEISQPNDLYDLEIAPQSTNRESLVELYKKLSLEVDQRLDTANKRLAQSNGDKEAERRLAAQIKSLKLKKDELKSEGLRVAAALDKFYDSKGMLLAAYKNHADAELKSVFSLPLLSHVRSNAIVLNPAHPNTILDHMRAKGLWK